jgi:hypothetical protein
VLSNRFFRERFTARILRRQLRSPPRRICLRCSAHLHLAKLRHRDWLRVSFTHWSNHNKSPPHRLTVTCISPPGPQMCTPLRPQCSAAEQASRRLHISTSSRDPSGIFSSEAIPHLSGMLAVWGPGRRNKSGVLTVASLNLFPRHNWCKACNRWYQMHLLPGLLSAWTLSKPHVSNRALPRSLGGSHYHCVLLSTTSFRGIVMLCGALYSDHHHWSHVRTVGGLI